ncbi:zinc transporter 2 [Agrilus planipennis]|uniref:Zinc transporter 2 n=1 Tax=Agrilus planipennis TaxID=224129 RepID=A0A1W4WW67_AGRPL|nr:zinc transporter 2 [Agrilus planipennis]
MKYVCDHDNSESEDEKFLLDDNNTEKHTHCKRCDIKNGFLNCKIQDKPLSWLANSNGNMKNHYVPVTNLIDREDNNESGFRSLNMPLLLNGNLEDRNDDQTEYHCHSNSTTYNNSGAWKKLIIVSIICIILMITELTGGCIAGSLAVMTDAAHLLTDLIGFCISIISLWLSNRVPNKTMTFGYSRTEVIGAFLSVLTVWLLAGVFCYLALHRLFRREFDIDADTMLIVASIGVVINVVMASVLHGFCHGHGHTHGPIISNTKENINVRAAAAHVIGDLCQSLGVFLAAIIIKVYPEAQAADPICTLLFSVVAIYATFKIARDVGKILLEASPEDVGNLMQLLKNIPGVKHVHEMHVWSLAPGREVLNVHLAVDKNCDRDVILEQAGNLINIKTSIISSSIQIEKYNPDVISNCNQCQILAS